MFGEEQELKRLAEQLLDAYTLEDILELTGNTDIDLVMHLLDTYFIDPEDLELDE